MPRIIPTLVLWMSLTQPALAQEQPFDALADEAVAQHPSLVAMQDREDALRARAAVAGVWPDPMIAIEYSNAPVNSFSISDHPMGGLQLRVQQSFRPPGWSRLGREVGNTRADASAEGTEEAALRLRTGVQRTGWLLTRTRLLKTYTEQHLARTEELIEAVIARYETGGVGQHAVLRLQVLRDRLADDLDDFTRSDKELEATLRTALSDPSDRHIATPTDVEAATVPPTADWMALATEHRPALSQLSLQREAAERSADLAQRDAIPDINVWAGYRIRTAQTATDPGTDFISLGVGVPIPVGSVKRNHGQRDAFIEEASGANAQREAALDQIRGEIDAILARWERAFAKSKAYASGLIPSADATLATTRSEFTVGRADFASLFDAEVTLLDLERAWIKAIIDSHLQYVALTAAIGVAPTGATP